MRTKLFKVLVACVLSANLFISSATVALSAEQTGSSTISPTSENVNKIALSTWHEALITTQDPQPWLELFRDYAGWVVLSESSIDPALLRSWSHTRGAPKTIGDKLLTIGDEPLAIGDKPLKGREIVLANPNTERGYLRLIHLSGIEQDWIRSDDRPWDTGGIFDLNIRAKDLFAMHKTLRAMGWQGDSIPNQVVFGPYEVVEWIARGPDGVRFAFIERVKPELEGFEFTKLSRLFNSTQTVADIEKSLTYYKDVLGMDVEIEHIGPSKEAGPNVLGLPHEITTEVPRIVYVLNGKDAASTPESKTTSEGKIEILAFDGATGRDLSAKASPFNIGLSVLRYKVTDLDAVVKALSSRGAEFPSEPVELTIPPYGKVRLVALRAPEGAHLEIFELISAKTSPRKNQTTREKQSH